MTKFVSVQLPYEGTERTLLINADKIITIGAYTPEDSLSDYAIVSLDDRTVINTLNEWFDLMKQLGSLHLIEDGSDNV